MLLSRFAAVESAISGAPNLSPAIAGLLASLPPDGEWTKTERDKFVRTFEAVLDFSFTVIEKRRKEADADLDEGDSDD